MPELNPAQFTTLWHATDATNAESIRRRGLDSDDYDERNWTLADSRGAAEDFATGLHPDPRVVEMHVPRDKAHEYLHEPNEYYSPSFYSTEAYAIKKPLPASWVHKVHRVGDDA